MTKMLRTTVLLAVVIVGMLGATAASAEVGGTARPYRVSGLVTGPIDTSWGYTVTGPSIGLHYGSGLTTVTGSFVSLTYVLETTAANGDVIRGAYVGPAAPVGNDCPVGWGPFSHVDRITGGTGRFDGATGTAHTWGCLMIDFVAGVFTIDFTSVGTISY